MNAKLEQSLKRIEELAIELSQENDEQSKQVSLILQILCSSIWVDQEKEFMKLIHPLAVKILAASKRNHII